MTTAVRIYSCEGLATLPVTSSGGAFRSDGVSAVIWPYKAKEVLSCDAATAATSAAASAPAKCKVLRVEVEVGKMIGFEITPDGQALRTADIDSPRLSGAGTFSWGAGWRFSCFEVSS